METLKERLEDKTKTPLSSEFVFWLRRIAIQNNMTPDELYALWKDYAKKCTAYDQSPVTSEFLLWNKLTGERLG